MWNLQNLHVVFDAASAIENNESDFYMDRTGDIKGSKKLELFWPGSGSESRSIKNMRIRIRNTATNWRKPDIQGVRKMCQNSVLLSISGICLHSSVSDPDPSQKISTKKGVSR